MPLEKFVSNVLGRELMRRYPRLYGIEEVGPKPSVDVEATNYGGNLTGHFVDDGVTGYLFLLDAKTREKLASCWLYNHVPSPSLSIALEYSRRGEAPPMPRDFKHVDFAPPRKYVTPSNITVVWNQAGSAVSARYKNRPLGVLAWDGFGWRSYPHHLLKPCEWGEPLSKQVKQQYSIG
jgi:hypothetical protein